MPLRKIQYELAWPCFQLVTLKVIMKDLTPILVDLLIALDISDKNPQNAGGGQIDFPVSK